MRYSRVWYLLARVVDGVLAGSNSLNELFSFFMGSVCAAIDGDAHYDVAKNVALSLSEFQHWQFPIKPNFFATSFP